MGVGNEITSTDRAIRKWVAVATVVVVAIPVWIWFLSTQGTSENDATDACNSRVLEIVTDVTAADITDTSARKSSVDTNPEYSNEWNAFGTITSDYMSGTTRPIPFSCTIYMDSSGNELDGKVSIDF